MMDILCTGFDGVYCYLDDIIVIGRTSREHDTRLTQLLQKLQKYGVTLNKQKCINKVKKLEWLGYVLSEEGVQMSDKTRPKPRYSHR